MRQVKVVTLKGHVISKTGSMTGGSSQRDGTDRWEEKVVACMVYKHTILRQLLGTDYHLSGYTVTV